MARAYGKNNTSRRNGQALNHVLQLCLAFIVGYAGATVFDFTHLTAWINAHFLRPEDGLKAIKPVNQNAQLPKPKFEFYTLLANEQRISPAPNSNQAQIAKVSQPSVAPATILTPAPVAPPAPATLATTQKLPLHEPLVASALQAKLPQASITKGAYLVQVGSFKNMREAERMKVGLVMKGFDVNVSRVAQQQTYWYRVSIGPFASREQAQKAQLACARSQHVMGMIRKMDA